MENSQQSDLCLRKRNTVLCSKSMRCTTTMRQRNERKKRKREKEAEHFIEERCDNIVFY